MSPYKTMYFHLFNAITDALRAMEAKNDQRAIQILITAQQWGENAYVESPEKKDKTE